MWISRSANATLCNGIGKLYLFCPGSKKNTWFPQNEKSSRSVSTQSKIFCSVLLFSWISLSVRHNCRGCTVLKELHALSEKTGNSSWWPVSGSNFTLKNRLAFGHMNAGKINPRLFGIAQMPPPHPRIAENCSMLRSAALGPAKLSLSRNTKET